MRAAILIGEAAGKLETVLAGRLPVHDAGTLERAVALAAKLAQPGDVVLLAPACASFDQFRGFEERGERFRRGGPCSREGDPMRRRGFNGAVRRRGPGPRRAGGPGASERRTGASHHFRPAAAPEAPVARAALDGGLIISAMILVSLGVVMVYSTTAPLAIGRTLPPYFVRHLFVTALAFTIAALALRVPLGVWRRLALPLWGVSVLLLFATLLVGDSANGAQRWLRVPHVGDRLPAGRAREMGDAAGGRERARAALGARDGRLAAGARRARLHASR